MRLLNVCAALVCVLLAFGALAQAPNATDQDGKKHGEWTANYPDTSQLRYQGQFEHGEPIGSFFYYYETGEKSSEVSHRGDGTSHAIYFHKNGAIMAEGDYMDQEKHGEWKFFDNQTILSSIEPYDHGKLNGTAKVYHVNGQLAAEIPYINGIKNGPFFEYTTKGKVRIAGTYKDNIYYGGYEQFYDDGAPYIKGQYRAGVKDGHWIEYTQEGRIKVQQVWERGKLIKEKFEEGFEPEVIKVDLEKEDVIDEQQLLDQMYNGTPPPR